MATENRDGALLDLEGVKRTEREKGSRVEVERYRGAR